MPEIGEVARAVHYLRKHLVGRTLEKVTAFEDANVFGKVGTSHTEIMKHLTGKKVVSAAQQGKYFWMIMNSPPHILMHFGMAGWFKFKAEHTFYYKKKEGMTEKEEWPPKSARILFETDGKGDDRVEAAFVDMRRFGRVRLIACPGKDIRKHSPLVENGPDPVQDKELVTVDWLRDLCARKKVPIKAMLLDQANISGIGNWVGDEIMYDAKIHPEQYCNTLQDDQIVQLHKSLHYVCGTAVDLLSQTDQFPAHWLFKHRWSKGKKEDPHLPNGEKIVFLTVGGRTSAVIPSVQKKTGPVAKDMSDAESDVPQHDHSKDPVSKDGVPKKGSKRKAKLVKDEEDESDVERSIKKQKRTKPRQEADQKDKIASAQKAKPRTSKAKKSIKEENEMVEKAPASRKAPTRTAAADSIERSAKSKKQKSTTSESGRDRNARTELDGNNTKRRRSARLSKG